MFEWRTASNAIYLGEDEGGKGRQFKARFLVPGLVKYDYGVCLLTKENADKFINGFTGCPVVINHQTVTDKNVKDVAVGDIFSVWFDEKDGYYWCNGILRDKEAIKLIDEGYSVSCQYLITEYSDNTSGKLHNGNPYDKIIENGKPEHLAIVNNPRYEGAIIAVNAIMAQNEDKWITIKPNGDDAKGRHLLLKDGETPQEAIERQYGNGGQMALGFPGAKKAQKDAKSYENKKNASRDKLYSIYMNDDVKGYGAKLVEALKEYNKYNDDGVDMDNIDAFVEKYEKQRDEEKTKTQYKKYIKEQSQKQSDTKDVSKEEEKTDISDSPFGEGVEIIEHDKKGMMLDSKNLKSYKKGDKFTIVDDWSHDGKDRFTVSFYDGKKKLNTKTYGTKRGMEKAIREHLQSGANKETKALEQKTDLNAAKEKYEDIVKKYNEADRARWKEGITNHEYYKAWDDYNKYKKELTTARREYAESIMSNFEEVENNPYEERQQARRDHFEEMAEQAQKTSERYAKAGQDMFDVIPFGQPIHGQKDRNYRDKAWGKFETSWKEQQKANYYTDKAKSVGKAGISADDANAIAKLAQKYKSGVDSAEKRRIIDRVISIHKNAQRASEAPKNEDYADLGFTVERNADINRLQLKFDGKPSESVRSILKHNGFRWSPREGAWQRQLNGNAEYGLKRVAEELKASNAFVTDFKDSLYSALAWGICNRLGEFLAQNKSNNPKEKWITIKGNHILLKDGESIADAFKRVMGVSLQKSNNPKGIIDLSGGNRKFKETLEKVKRDNDKDITPNQVIESAIKSLQASGKKYTPEEIKKKIQEADEYNLNIVRNNWETYKYHSDGKGHYKKNRQELHKKILNDLFLHANMAKPKDGEKPTFMVLGGRGGSGKSKFNGLVYDKSKYIVLDADAIKEMLPEYKGYNAFEVHEESSDILKKALKIAQKRGLNVVLDGTMKSLGSTEKKVKSFNDAGYNIEMYYMHLPREKAAERAIGRFMGNNGRYVPLDILLDMKNNEDNFNKLKKYASKWAFYNNDVPSSENKPILIDKNF